MTSPASIHRRRQRLPEGMLVFGFLAVILLGTVLLSLPVASRDHHSIGLFNGLFTATSAVCVTGLVAVDTGASFSTFGQVVLLILIQVGGLGFMVFATRVMVLLGRRITIKDRMLIRESMNGSSLSDLATIARLYLLLAIGIEAMGALLLSIRFIPMFGPGRGLWYALFHAVSAFCNAGFDLFGHYSSLTAFADDPLILQLMRESETIFRAFHFVPRLKTLPNQETVHSYVENGLGVALLDEWCNMLHRPTILHMSIGEMIPVAMAWRENARPSTTELLCTALHDVFQEPEPQDEAAERES